MSATHTVNEGAPSTAAELTARAWFHNPASGELARVNVAPAETDGRRIEVDLWLQPGAAVARAHTHDHLVERFEVLAREVCFHIAGDERVVRPGDGVAEVPVRAVHDWWNAGDGIAEASELHGPAAPCVIADPGDDGLARLLARPVGARAARGRG